MDRIANILAEGLTAAERHLLFASATQQRSGLSKMERLVALKSLRALRLMETAPRTDLTELGNLVAAELRSSPKA